MTPRSIGLLFLMGAVVSILVCRACGQLMEKWKNPVYHILIGLFLLCLVHMLSGPMYPIPFGPSVPSILVRQTVYGCALPFLLVGGFAGASMVLESMENGTDTLKTHAALASLYQATFAVG